MSAPLVSVCLPNLNNRRYLEERLETIFSQTYTNWELVVSDNYSDDGAWEYFQEVAARDKRVLIEQAPRQGLYPNWNKCIERARGEYVYIATSDDTMAPDCLEKLVAALEAHPECDLAQCPMVTIDEHGRRSSDFDWLEHTVFKYGIPELVDQKHLRHAPYDGFLHLTGYMVYFSITTILIRRSLFERTGGFEGRWGSIGDRNWDMKAGLVASTVYVPDTWASWRHHSAGATAQLAGETDEYARKIQEMKDDALAKCAPYLAPEVVAGLREHWMPWSSDMYEYYRGLRSRPDSGERKLYQAAQMRHGRHRTEAMQRMLGKPRWSDRAPGEMRSWLASLGADPVVTLPQEVGK